MFVSALVGWSLLQMTVSHQVPGFLAVLGLGNEANIKKESWK